MSGGKGQDLQASLKKIKLVPRKFSSTVSYLQAHHLQMQTVLSAEATSLDDESESDHAWSDNCGSDENDEEI